MILRIKHGNILMGSERHIAFAVNVEGFNRYGFPRQVIDLGWKELARPKMLLPLGQVYEKEIGDKVYHALVCYSLKHGWQDTAAILEACFANIQSREEVVATVNIGTGNRGKALHANPDEIEKAMMDTSKKLTLYYY